MPSTTSPLALLLDPRPRWIIGVDPGLGGAIALYDTEGDDHAVWDMPVIHRTQRGKKDLVDPVALANLVASILDGRQNIVGVVEAVGSRPRQAGAFNFGVSAGVVHGVLASHGVSYALIAPSVWKMTMGLTSPCSPRAYDEAKEASRQMAIRVFPGMSGCLKRKKDDGRAEALLIALFAASQVPR